MTSASEPPAAWEQAALLMQPALIRLLDHLRKHLERSPWQGNYHYETVEVWPTGTSPEEQAEVNQLHQRLDQASPTESVDLEQDLAKLAEPQMLYLLQLNHGNVQQQINLWELCYQVCFADYTPTLERSQIADFPLDEIQVDATLWDADAEIDWERLDHKVGSIVDQLFAHLATQVDQ